MYESTNEKPHHNHHHKSKGLNNENLRRNSFETYTSDNAPLHTSPPPQYTLHPSPPGSFYTYSTYTPPQQGMMYASNIPPVPAYYPYPQYIPVSGSYQTPATHLELQRDRLEKFEHLHEEQVYLIYFISIHIFLHINMIISYLANLYNVFRWRGA